MLKKEQKQLLRQEIRSLKKLHSEKELSIWSSALLDNIETLAAFQKAATVLLYYSLPDEVNTSAFIKKWSKQKCVLLPVVCGNDLELREYVDEETLTDDNSFHIKEPTGKAYTDFDNIDLAIIPGMGFDKYGHRLGRGKGFYDRLLPKIKAQKIGICFSFQVAKEIPTEDFDLAMDEVWTENGKLE